MVNKFEQSIATGEGLEITSQVELEEAKRVISRYQEAVERYEALERERSVSEVSEKSNVGRIPEPKKLEKGWEYPYDDTALIKGKDGSYIMELKRIENDMRPETWPGFDVKKVEGGWEVKVKLRTTFNTRYNIFFKLDQEGIVLEVIKPAIIHGHEEDGKIIVDSLVKGELRMSQRDE